MTPSCSSRAGFSLLELLAVVTVIGIIAAIAFAPIGDVNSSAQETRLTSDVKVINQAVAMYLANGGSLDGLSAPQEILDKLKTVAASDRLVGFQGAMVDKRMAAVMQTASEAATDAARALWNGSAQKFEIGTTGSNGVARFDLDASLAGVNYGAEDRESPVLYAANDGWIWDYQDSSANGKTTPTAVPLYPGDAGSGGGSSSGDGGPDDETDDGGVPGMTTLSPPVFSIGGGSFPLRDFTLSLTLANPNAVDSSQIYYKVGNGGAYTAYNGGVIPVSWEQEIFAYAESLDLERFRSSSEVSENYGTNPVALNLSLTSGQIAYSYYDLVGGGSSALAQVTNLTDLPDSLLSGSGVEIFWTTDGSDPQTSSFRSSGSGLTGQSIPFEIASWGDEDTVTIQAYAAASHDYVQSSAVQSLSLSRITEILPNPVISTTEMCGGKYRVILTAAEDLPTGARIYYTTDGSLPAMSDEGVMTNGIAYNRSFTVELDEYEPIRGSSGSSGGVGQTVTISGGNGDVPIKSLTLSANGVDIVQTSSYSHGSNNQVVNSQNTPIQLKSITIEKDGQLIVADHLNVLQVELIQNNFPHNSYGVTTVEDGKASSRVGDSDFSDAIERVLSSTNLRDYMSYDIRNSRDLEAIPYEFAMRFAPMRNGDYLVVMERWGNSTFELVPLNSAGKEIAGSNKLRFEGYAWNTGYAPNDYKQQPFYFSVIEIAKFGVDTDKTLITGFGVNNDDGADFKFFTISDESFENRSTQYLPKTIHAQIFPPKDLMGWFISSDVSSTELPD